MIVPLARGYHAYTKLVVFATPLGHVRSRNRRRKDAIPTKVLASQIERFRWPEIREAHEVQFMEPSDKMEQDDDLITLCRSEPS